MLSYYHKKLWHHFWLILAITANKTDRHVREMIGQNSSRLFYKDLRFWLVLIALLLFVAIVLKHPV